MENRYISYSKEDGVGYITLNITQSGGQLDLDGAGELLEICDEINRQNDVNAVVLTGAGNNFCAGYTRELVNSISDRGFISMRGPAETVAKLELPTLAAINGEAKGGGLELALACDLRIASEKAIFGLPQILAGTIPVDGGTQRLSRIVGKGKALEMVLTGEMIDSKTAFEIGLANKVVAHDKLLGEVKNLARSIAAKAPLALRYCKEAVMKGTDLSLDQGLRLEADLYFLLHTASDRTEGIKSFLGKRAPKYQGK
jgi:enoyl-CoA hydratase